MDRWVERGVSDFGQTIKQGNLGDMRRAMHSYWAQRASLSPYLVWPDDEKTFAEYFIDLATRLKETDEASELVLRELFYTSAQEWTWTSGFQGLSEIIQILRYFLDGERNYLSVNRITRSNYFIDIHSMTATDLFDRMCGNIYSGGSIPNLYDNITASYFSNSCLILYFSQKYFPAVGSPSERVGLAQFCLRLLNEMEWKSERIAPQYFAGPYLWGVGELARTKMLAAELPRLWRKIIGQDFDFSQIDKSHKSSSPFYSFPRACALLEETFNFRHKDILVRPPSLEASRSSINELLAL